MLSLDFFLNCSSAAALAFILGDVHGFTVGLFAPPGHKPYVVGSTKCLQSGQSFGSSSASKHIPAGGSPTGCDELEAGPELLGSFGSLICRQGQFGVSHLPGPKPFAINSFSRQHVSSPDRLLAYRDPPGPVPLEETS